MGTSLVIVEVSQKQAYIFSSNKLKDNINNSEEIAYVTSSSYFSSCASDLYREEGNEVYCGGGHSVLEFKDHESAKAFIKKVTMDVKENHPGIELFATIYDCESEPSAESISELIKQLEQKKAVRRASFTQETFGVEDVDSRTRDTQILTINGHKVEEFESDDKKDRDAYPDGFERALEFENLGGSKDESNFIAVVHIDGNAMGKRVEDLRKAHEEEPWDSYRKVLKTFSDSIDKDYKSTFSEMCTVVGKNIIEGTLGDIKLKEDEKSQKYYFPVRRVIDEGDDICFVTEGRIGIECARIFIEILNQKTNDADHKPYTACAGVAIVHQKYPFYMAYELAESLCSNAKKYAANAAKDMGEGVKASDVCAIDWHMDFGELGDGIEEIREEYNTDDGKRMELRPYLISGPEVIMEKESARNYQNFKKVIESINGENAVARGKLKGLRNYIREGETATWNYLKANSIEDIALNCYQGIYTDLDMSKLFTGNEQERCLFIKTADGEERSTVFDAIEAMDTFIPLVN